MPTPFTEDEKRRIKELGLDPSNLEWGDEDRQTAEPTINTSITNPAVDSAMANKPFRKISGGESLARQAGQQALPLTAGLAAGAKVTGVTAPFIGPYSLIPGAIAGLGATALAKFGQDKALKAIQPNIEELNAQDLAQNPIASRVGIYGPQLATFKFAPGANVKGIYQAGRGMAGRTLTAAEAELAKGAALNLGVNAGSSLAYPMIEGRSPTGEELISGAAQAMLLGGPRTYLPGFMGGGTRLPAENQAIQRSVTETSNPKAEVSPSIIEQQLAIAGQRGRLPFQKVEADRIAELANEIAASGKKPTTKQLEALEPRVSVDELGLISNPNEAANYNPNNPKIPLTSLGLVSAPAGRNSAYQPKLYQPELELKQPTTVKTVGQQTIPLEGTPNANRNISDIVKQQEIANEVRVDNRAAEETMNNLNAAQEDLVKQQAQQRVNDFELAKKEVEDQQIASLKLEAERLKQENIRKFNELKNPQNIADRIIQNSIGRKENWKPTLYEGETPKTGNVAEPITGQEKLQSGLALPEDLLASAVDMARTAIKAGKNIAQAVAEAISHIKSKYGNNFNESEAQARLYSLLGDKKETSKDWYVGNVHQGEEVRAAITKDATHPYLVAKGINIGDLRQRFRYDPYNKQVVWSDEPTSDSKNTVENWLAKKGIEDIKHTVWLDGADWSEYYPTAKKILDENAGGKLPEEVYKNDTSNIADIAPEYKEAIKYTKTTDNPNFKRWFEGSKVVDEEGKPLVVYHGTDTDVEFDKFRTPQKGAWFAVKPENARGSSGENPAKTYPVYLDIKNPYVLEGAELEAWRRSSNPRKFISDRSPSWKFKGYDGVKIGDYSYVAFKPEQIKSAYGNTGEFSPDNPSIMHSGIPIPEIPPSTSHTKGIAPKWTGSRSMIDNVRAIDNPLAGEAATRMDRFWEGVREFHGKYNNKTLAELREIFGLKLSKGASIGEAFNDSNPEAKNVMSYLDDIGDYGKSDISLTPDETVMLNKYLSWREKHNIATGDEIRNRPGLHGMELGSDMSGIANDPKNYNKRAEIGLKQLNTILNHGETPEAIQLKKDFLKYQKEFNPDVMNAADPDEAALDALRVKLDAYSNKPSSEDSGGTPTFYGPAEKAAGINVPKSWRPESPIERETRYDTSLGKRLAFYDSLDTKNPANKEFTDKFYDPMSNLYTHKDVQENLRYIYGKRPQTSAVADAASGVVKAFMFSGPGTGAKDVITSLVGNASEYETPIQSVKAAADSLKNFAENRQKAIDNGLIKDFGAIEMGDSTKDPTYWLQKIRRGRDWVTKLTGRDIAEQMARTISYGKGRWILDDNYTHGLNNGGELTTYGKRFLEDFGEGLEWKKHLDNGEALPEAIADKIAARYSENAQSTYDPRDTPHYLMEGQFAPYLSIMRWNFNRYNRFYKGVVIPLSKGNPLPFISATIGMLASGLAVKAYTRNIISGGRKEHEPEVEEIAQAAGEGKPVMDDVAYKAIALMDAAGYAGIMGVLAKSAMDKMYKNNVMPIDSPLVNAIGNSYNTLIDIAEAVKEGTEPTEVALNGVSKVIEDNIQAYRIILNNFSADKQEKIDRSNKFRDLKTFKSLYDYPVTDSSKYKSNPFINRDVKKFKQTGDMGEARELRKSIIEEARQKYAGDPIGLKDYYRSLKRNSYQTMPSPETDLKKFKEYKRFLTQTQGEGEAQERQKDYLKQKRINSAKSQMIP